MTFAAASPPMWSMQPASLHLVDNYRCFTCFLEAHVFDWGWL